MLKSVKIKVYPNSDGERILFSVAGIDLLYSKGLKKAYIGEIKTIEVFLVQSESMKITEYADLIIADCFFDFYLYSSLDLKLEKTMMILDATHNCLLNLAKMYGWDSQIFLDANLYCYQRDLIYSWNFKNKYFASPNKKYFFSLYHVVDFYRYEIFEIIYDDQQKEIIRRLCFADDRPTFKIDEANWIDEKTFKYKFKGPNKIFFVNINDVFNGQKYNLATNTSQFFK